MTTGIRTTEFESEDRQQLNLIILGFGLLKFLIHLFTLEGYGLHADELYYIELSRHLSWGYLDISPFVTWISWISEILFGNATFSFRVLPCLFSSATVIATGYITKLLGGKRLAVIIACSALICSPSFLATSYLLQPAVFDQFFWTLLILAVIAYQQHKKTSWLYLAALALGIGMLNKYSILLLAASILLAILIITPASIGRHVKKLSGPVLLCVFIILPNLIWQFFHGLPILHYTASVGKNNFEIDLWDYLLQLFFFHGASVAIWTAGLIYLWFERKDLEQLKYWTITFLIVTISLTFLKGKLYYGLGIFPLLFAAGGHCWAQMLTRKSISMNIFFIGMIYFFALLSLPIVIPIFSVETCRAYSRKMIALTDFSRPLRYEDGSQGGIPQFFADMTGWQELTSRVNSIANTQISENKKGIYILTNNYAIAGALKFYGKPGIPKVISPDNSFLLYSPDQLNMRTIIYLSKDSPQMVDRLAKNVKLLGKLSTENSHINGLYIYRLIIPSLAMKQKYVMDRIKFYPDYGKKINLFQNISSSGSSSFLTN
ncbi:glycosyltransferase family 39 protein [Pedobacter sp. G11]|uniref:ArnT family glycosyltransferase n=1 Tax=Pedobacter sp. G11 TaxID=2482728 RepID=UPI00143DED9D|nr:glycosyltransferase family 39 protein [Pedobacter sp. G11]